MRFGLIVDFTKEVANFLSLIASIVGEKLHLLNLLMEYEKWRDY